MLDQRQRDVLGLALLALGVFMGFVLYGPAAGGTAGAPATGSPSRSAGCSAGRGCSRRWRSRSPAERCCCAPCSRRCGRCAPVRSACSPSVTLALAAGTLGLSSGPGAGAGAWRSAFLQSHGGVVGEALYQLAHRLVQDVGVEILVVFLLLAGVILLTGASLASAIRATGSGLLDTTRMVAPGRRGTPGLRTRGGASPQAPEEELAPVSPPEPVHEQLIVRATHVEAPSRDWREQEAPAAADADGADAAGAGRRGRRRARG